MNPSVNDRLASPPPVRAVRMLLVGAGSLLLVTALVYNEIVLGVLLPEATAAPGTVVKIRLVQLYLAISGAASIVLGSLAGRLGGLRTLANRTWVANLVLVILAIGTPVWIAELTLRPFTVLHRKSTIFVRDPDLGWRLRPGVEGRWFGTPVKINAKGLRGPEIDYAKPPGVFRVLYLGDSVTFGFGLADHAETFPYRVAEVLREHGDAVETVNAGVDGYSPWQERLFLEREGLRYDPDLVVVTFVLNDVTEKLSLVRFGGSSEGFQLENSYLSAVDRLMSHSAIVQTARRVGARARFGDDIREGAIRQQWVEVRALVDRPDDPEIREAWTMTADNLRGLFAVADVHDVPVLLVLVPFRFQLDDPEGSSVPQREALALASEAGVAAIDLLPILTTRMRERGETPDDYFLDADHLTALGSEIVARSIARRIVEEGWLSGH
jgi:lysophospholipase L1-like esterase